MSLTNPSTRIALAAFLHDVGKLAERVTELDYRRRSYMDGRSKFEQTSYDYVLSTRRIFAGGGLCIGVIRQGESDCRLIGDGFSAHRALLTQSKETQ